MSRRSHGRISPPPEWLRVGARVDYRSIVTGPVTHPNREVLTPPWQLGNGEWVVKIQGVHGGVWIEALTPVANSAEASS